MKLKTVLLGSIAAAVFAVPAYAIDIKIGVLNDRSGIYTDMSGEGSAVAARMAVEDFDAAGKGINVEIVTADHQNRADVASSVARQWYDVENVDVIVDVPNTSAALTVHDASRERNKVFLGSGVASSDLTGSLCSPNTIHWTYDTWQLANGTGRAVVESGGDSWFFLTADYAFGHALERDTSAVVEASGGTVVGSVRHPFPGQDFSSFLLQAQASGAKVIGLANGGGDTVNSIKQAAEFGIVQAGQTLAGLLIFITDVHGIGLQDAQGLVLTESFYWDLDDDTREWTERYEAAGGPNKPVMTHAGVYSAVLHYLKAVEALGDKDDGAAVVQKMKELPTEDPLFGQGEIRADGRKIHDSYLFRVKSPEESEGPWDYYEVISTTPAAQAFRPVEDGGCPLVE